MAETATKAKAKSEAKPADAIARLRAQYNQQRPDLVKELGLKNLHEAPQLDKIVVNIGLGRAKDDKRGGRVPPQASGRTRRNTPDASAETEDPQIERHEAGSEGLFRRGKAGPA